MSARCGCESRWRCGLLLELERSAVLCEGGLDRAGLERLAEKELRERILHMTLNGAAKGTCTHCFIRSLLDEERNGLLVEVERHILLRETAAQESQLQIEDDLNVLGVELAEIKTGIDSMELISLAGTVEVSSLFRRMGTVLSLR